MTPDFRNVSEDTLRYLRQIDAVDMQRLSSLNITIIGAGAIGSTTAVWLGKMGVHNIVIYDDDIVETHNWSNQMYREVDIGKPKALALQEVMVSFGLPAPIIHPVRYTDQPLSDIVISAVDSMSSRKTIWKSVRNQSQVQLFLDARMGLETLMVYAVIPQPRSHRISYSQTLYSDAEALQEPCTARSICYTPLMSASILCNLVKRYVNNERCPELIMMDLGTLVLVV